MMQKDSGLAPPVIHLAMVHHAQLSHRDIKLIAMYKRGDSLLSIAERFGITCADVQRTVARVGDLGRVLADPVTTEEHVGGIRQEH